MGAFSFRSLLVLAAILWFVPSASGQTPASAPAPADPHAGHVMPADAPEPKPNPAEQELPPFIPRLTDEDRQAAFPDVGGHAAHDEALNYYARFDQFEWQAGGGSSGFRVDTSAWLGGDRNRLWFRAEGDGSDGDVEAADAAFLFGHQFARWWDVVAGVRQDFSPGDAQTWGAFGIQGIAPYWFDIEATAYVGASGIAARFEVEYDLLVTNRLVLQPRVEGDLFGEADESRGRGAGLSTTDTGLRLRYEIRRELAPYVGLTWRRLWGDTRGLAGEINDGARLVTGLRFWF